ncbi:MAG: formate dehydrogenase subunit alpha [Alphaproteobacteria bacterium]|nr:formate dehydrogenase subunit alpha [Alphaproteobacteria bacterium]
MRALNEADLGTPEADGPPVVVVIDGLAVSVPAGTSLMRAAALAGIDIPRLCATDFLKASGGCRLCLVEIEGRRGHPAACTTPVEAGMVARTEGETLDRLRRGVMALHVSDHPLDCLTCAANGRCEFQAMAARLGVVAPRPNGANHLDRPIDSSNPYFTFDPARCVLCARCVRACGEVQGSFALTLAGRGFDMVVRAAGPDLLGSECVSCGACVQACPTAALIETSAARTGRPDRVVTTTCGYCGVGCALKVEARGERVVRVVPAAEGYANRGHACVKGRFAWGWADHPDRVTTPLVRESIDQPWRQASWDEAIRKAARGFTRIRERFGPRALGGITSSRCTNEEVWLVQKLVRTAFGSNNVDTCARVCHAPTGYGLKQAFGTSAGTQDFDSVERADLVMVIGANPGEAHPVFAARLKRRLRQGARLVVIDPRATDLVASPHIRADVHLSLAPGTNVAVLNALAHVLVAEGLLDDSFIARRGDADSFAAWRAFVADPRWSPEAVAVVAGVEAADLRRAARLYAGAGNAAIYYGLGVTEHTQGSTAVMAIANLAMATGNIGRPGVGVNPLRGQNNVQGSCDMGSFPHEFSGYRAVSDEATRHAFERDWGVALDPEPGLRIPDMLAGGVKGLYVQGEDLAQSDPDTRRVRAALAKLDLLVVQDLFLNETARYAHVFLPGTAWLEKDGTFTNAERRVQRVRPVMPPKAGLAEWQVTQALATAMGRPETYRGPAAIMAEIARLTPAFAGIDYAALDQAGGVQWPCPAAGHPGTPIMHLDDFARGRGHFAITDFVPSPERTNRRFPLLLTTGRVLSQYNVGTQTRRTANLAWHREDLLELHPHDAAERGLRDGDRAVIESRSGEIALTVRISDRVPAGVAWTSFHFPHCEANVLTTGNADWATSCPEYKVTAVQVTAVPRNVV